MKRPRRAPALSATLLLLLLAPATSPAKERSRPPVAPLDLESAVRAGLSANPEFVTQRLAPSKRSAEVALEAAAFDPALEASASGNVARRDRRGPGAGAADQQSRADSLAATRTRRMRDGTVVAWRAEIEGTRTDLRTDEREARLGYDLRVPLLRGRGEAVNLAPLRIRGIALERSRHEVAGLALALAWRICEAYWDAVDARARITVYDESLKISRRELTELRERVKIGSESETALSLLEAEVARREELRIDAEATAADRALALARLLGEPMNGLPRELSLTERIPAATGSVPPPEAVVARALARRPELAEARLRLDEGALELVRTRDGLLPRLDLFATLGKGGLSDAFGGALEGLLPERGFDARVGLAWSDEPDRRAARSRDTVAKITLKERELALRNLESLLSVEALKARNELTRAIAQGKATRSTLAHREKALAAERERLAVGRSTPFSVAQASRDVLDSRTAALAAQIATVKAELLLDYRQGTLLDRFAVTLEP